MFIRRNMSSNVSYQELKQYSLFKQLAKINDLMILKEILPMVVKKVSLDIQKQAQTKKHAIYIPEQDYQAILQGQSLKQLLRKMQKQNIKKKFFMIERKIYNILKYVFYKKIECLENMKNFEKLNFFYRCDFYEIPFGSYVYRKSDQITHIYYLVRGQVQITKSRDEKQVNIVKLQEGNFFGIYEFEKNKSKRILNACSSSNSTIVVGIELDLLGQLFGKDQNQVIEKLIALKSEISKINKEKQNKTPFQACKIEKISFIKAHDFHRRLMKFSEERKNVKKDPVFAKYVENKSLLYKIKDSNDSFPRQQKQKINVYFNFHKKESTTKHCHRLNQHRMLTLSGFLGNSFGDQQGKKKQRKSQNILLNSSRLKQKYLQSKRQFSMVEFDPIQTLTKSQIIN